MNEDRRKVLKEGATEAPGSGALLHNKELGVYSCGSCSQELFKSDHKFDSGSGWPSFFQAADGSVELRTDTSHGMERVEVVCSRCGGHLGHVFDDAVNQPGGRRYCINSLALDFKDSDGTIIHG